VIQHRKSNVVLSLTRENERKRLRASTFVLFRLRMNDNANANRERHGKVDSTRVVAAREEVKLLSTRKLGGKLTLFQSFAGDCWIKVEIFHLSDL
jgi:hypothetical protein